MSASPRRTAPRDGLRLAIAQLFFGLPLYSATLWRPRAAQIRLWLHNPWPGDIAEANHLFQGRYRFAGEEVLAPMTEPWRLPDMSDAWRAELQGFGWLRHFEAAGGDAAHRQTRALIDSWIANYQRFERFAWRPDILGRRLINWFSHAEFLFRNTDSAWRDVFLDSLGRQSRHLARTVNQAPAGPGRLAAAVGLVYVGLALLPRKLKYGLRALERELVAEVLPDGGHVLRDPSLLLRALQDLVALRQAMIQAQTEVPESLQHAIDRMAPALRAFRHGDGGLALFNGGREDADATIDFTLARSEAKGKPPASLPFSGFERLSARRMLMIVDVGQPQSTAAGSRAHAGCLSFELSLGRERMMVNCGAPENPSGDWARAMRATAAHSTLCLNDTDSLQLGPQGRPVRLPVPVISNRAEADGSIWLEASHSGYQSAFGLSHRRRLYLDASGDDLRGEDALVGRAPAQPLPFAIRFHLHPNIQASPMQSGVAVLLRTPTGAGFRFRVEGGAVTVEESVYLGFGQPRRAEQIVVRGAAEGTETVVKWRLSRVPN